MKYNDGKAHLDYLEINLWDGCNLCCAGCTHLASLFPNTNDAGYKELSLESDLIELASLVSIRKIRLLGGEPFLHPNLIECLQIVRKSFPDSQLHIVSNGLLIPKLDDAVLSSLSELNYQVDISLYEPTLKQIRLIEDRLNSFGLARKISGYVYNFYKTLNLDGSSDAQKAFNSCHMSFCHMLRSGKLYKCPIEGFAQIFADYFEIVNVPLLESKRGIDVHALNSEMINEILESYNHPIDLCTHCSEKGGSTFKWYMNRQPQYRDWICDGE